MELYICSKHPLSEGSQIFAIDDDETIYAKLGVTWDKIINQHIQNDLLNGGEVVKLADYLNQFENIKYTELKSKDFIAEGERMICVAQLPTDTRLCIYHYKNPDQSKSSYGKMTSNYLLISPEDFKNYYTEQLINEKTVIDAKTILAQLKKEVAESPYYALPKTKE